MPGKAENLSTLETDPIKTDGGESPGDGHGAKQYWSGNLDPLNLEPGRRSKRTLCLEDEIAFASAPDVAEAQVEEFRARLEELLAKPVPSGRFGASMDVELVNTGPVTILLEK